MASTKIEWAEKVWNPITGCLPISEGCDHCYAKRQARRFKGRYGYPADDPFRVTVHWDRIEQPMHWIKSTSIFVCSMADLFHPDVPLNVTKDIFDVMRRSANMYGHTFMVLTKRPKRMAEFIELLVKDKGPDFRRWPMPFVWLGVTAENQKRADERIPILLQIPAAVRFVSVEPMLSEIDMRIVPCGACNHPGDVLNWPCPSCKGRRFEWPDWVICGGETGPGARPMHQDWVRSLRDQCVAASVPFFFKKWGDKMKYESDYYALEHGEEVASRLLGCREWNEFPDNK